MRHLSDINNLNYLNNLNFIEEINFNTSSVCCYNDQITSVMYDLVYKYTTIIVLLTFNTLLFVGIFAFITKLIYKKIIVYTDDKYQTTITINHMV
jgi:hypothetical protein